jgi:hypothetical protein
VVGDSGGKTLKKDFMPKLCSIKLTEFREIRRKLTLKYKTLTRKINCFKKGSLFKMVLSNKSINTRLGKPTNEWTENIYKITIEFYIYIDQCIILN